MSDERALLDEFFIKKSHNPKLFDVFTAISILFVAFVLAEFAIDLRSLSVKQFDWLLASIFLVLPFLGLIFHILSKKIGWIINCFYYVFISSATAYGFARNLFRDGGLEDTVWSDLIPLALAVTATVILLSHAILKYFRIKIILVICVCTVSVGLVIVMFAMLSE
jgi:hypothetical protein